MGLREWANNHPKVSASIAGGFIVVCVGAFTAELIANRKGYPTSLPDAYFSIDDGKSYFVDSTSNFPPFPYDGGQAVRAYVFQCGSGKKFVGYLERFTAASKKQLDAGGSLSPTIMRFGREIKRPGATNWEKTGDLAVESRVENITCPDGNGTLENIEP